MATVEVESDGKAHGRDEIVPSVSINYLLQQRLAVLERFTQAAALLGEAQRIAATSHLGFPAIMVATSLGSHGHSLLGEHSRFDVPQMVEAIVDAGGWAHLMAESGLRSLMPANKRATFDEQVHKLKSPPLTREAIYATFEQLHAARRDMFDEGVAACFKALSWEYKTNLPQCFGKRIIMTYLGAHWGEGIDYRAADRLDDLVRVFSILDGKPEPDHRQGVGASLGAAASKMPGHYPKRLEHEYFTLKLFRNRNGHITFKRLDLVEDLNGIIARHFPGALPAPRTRR